MATFVQQKAPSHKDPTERVSKKRRWLLNCLSTVNGKQATYVCSAQLLQMAAARNFSLKPDADVLQSVGQNSRQRQSGVGVKARL